MADKREASSHDGGVDGQGWHAARASLVDTPIAPDWLRTEYLYFPFAALQDGQWWTLRVNFYCPACDFATLFSDDSAVAAITASLDDARPLLASIGRLPLDPSPQQHNDVPVMSAALAQRAVEVLAPFIIHGTEWRNPCELCESAERSPFEPAAGNTEVGSSSGDGQAQHHG